MNSSQKKRQMKIPKPCWYLRIAVMLRAKSSRLGWPRALDPLQCPWRARRGHWGKPQCQDLLQLGHRSRSRCHSQQSQQRIFGWYSTLPVLDLNCDKLRKIHSDSMTMILMWLFIIIFLYHYIYLYSNAQDWTNPLDQALGLIDVYIYK